MAFLVFEGLDGSGKSTLIKNLTNHLSNQQLTVTVTREPGGTTVGEELREMLLKKQEQPPCAKTELLIYEAIRAQHVEYKIKPALQSGAWVLCDRFTASSVAFQSGGREISMEETQWLNHFATSGLQPDFTVLLDIRYKDAQARMGNANRAEKDRIESEGAAFHNRVRDSYLQQAEGQKNWLVLDATQSEQTLTQQLIEALTAQGFLD